MTVHDAIARGKLVVNLPVLAIILGGGFLSLKLLRGAWIVLGEFLAIPMAWIWWSLALPRWRLWALRSGCDPDELQAQAERVGLLWPKGHFFEKTELPPREK